MRAILVFAVLALITTPGWAQTKTRKHTRPAPAVSKPTPVTGDPVRTATGLEYWDIKVGDGALADRGKIVFVHYTGWLTNGKKFDSSVGTGHPFKFHLGNGEVIKGWDQGVAGMKVGGKRQLRIPPDLAYGNSGYPGVIPAGATLIFDVELVGVN